MFRPAAGGGRRCSGRGGKPALATESTRNADRPGTAKGALRETRPCSKKERHCLLTQPT
jgi:hypothetical protein